MAKISNNINFPKMRRVVQRTDSHCGPAVLQMLLSYLKIYIDQDKFVSAAGVKHKLKKMGMSPLDLAHAALKTTKKVKFWYKQNTTYSEISRIIHHYHSPVGIEWLGEFGKYSDGDEGHYSVAVGINLHKKTITIADPYKHFVKADRIFDLKKFNRLFWDVNEVVIGRKHKLVKDRHMIFVITSKYARFPKKFKMKQVVKIVV